MLFSETVHALRARSQRVTRRVGFEDTTAGDIIEAVPEMWMLTHPGRVRPTARLRVVSTRQEPLRRLLDEPEYAREEFILSAFPPNASVKAVVVDFVARHRNTTPSSNITRIEFDYERGE